MASLIALLRAAYGNAECALNHKNAFELLMATILSAQCTDKRVNLVTPSLFARYPTPAALAAADPEAVEHLIRTTGFFRNKTKSLLGASRALEARHGGQVPADMEALLALPGVARKTANVVLGVAFNIASGVVVDTHVARLSVRLGLTQHTDPVKIERDLMAIVPQDTWIALSHLLIHHGRAICAARTPACARCTLQTLCPSAFAATAPARTPRAARAKTTSRRAAAADASSVTQEPQRGSATRPKTGRDTKARGAKRARVRKKTTKA